MEINKRYKIWKCASVDPTRPTYRFIKFMGGYAYATSGYIAVRVAIQYLFSPISDAEIDILNGKEIDMVSFQKAAQCDNLLINDEGFFTDSETSPQLFGFSKQSPELFGGVETVIDQARNTATSGTIKEICFNTKYLNDLRQAMGINIIKMRSTATDHILFCQNPFDEENIAEGIICLNQN